MKKVKYLIILIILILFGIIGRRIYIKISSTTTHPITGETVRIGDRIDSFNEVNVYYNGPVSNVTGRNRTLTGYNLGLKYQCVEFVKRYYYEYFDHKMPDTYGHAKDFFDESIPDGEISPKRNLIQYTNPSKSRPEVSDLVIFGPTTYNRYGHVAIISAVTDDEIEIIQQNPGPSVSSRVKYKLENIDGKWEIKNKRTLGWLRKEKK